MNLIQNDDHDLIPVVASIANQSRLTHKDVIDNIDKFIDAFEQFGNDKNTRIVNIQNGVNMDSLEEGCYIYFLKENKYEPAAHAKRIRSLIEKLCVHVGVVNLVDLFYIPDINTHIDDFLSKYKGKSSYRLYDAYIRRGLEILESLVLADEQINTEADSLPRGFIPALRLLLDSAIFEKRFRSMRDFEMCVFGSTGKLYTVLKYNRILQKSEDVIKIEDALGVERGVLLERYYRWRVSRKINVKYEGHTLLSVFPEEHPIRQNRYKQIPIKDILPADTIYRTKEDQEKIVKWIDETFFVDNINFREAQKYKSTVINKEIIIDVQCPEKLQNDWESLHEFKTSKITEYGLLRDRRWKGQTPEFYKRYIADACNALVAEYAIEAENIRLAHFCFPRVIRRAAEVLATVRALGGQEEIYTATHINSIKRLKSLITERYGYYYQKGLPVDIEPLPGLVTKEEIQAARLDWKLHCEQANDNINQYLRDIEEYMVRQDPFYPISVVLDQDNPVGYFRRVLEYMDFDVPSKNVAKVEFITNRVDAAIFHMGLEAPLRNDNSVSILRAKPFYERCAIQDLEERREGELLYDKEGKYIIRVPVENFKNRDSSFFDGHREWSTPISRELAQRLEALERDVYPLMSEEPRYIFAKLNGSAFDDEYINRRWKVMMARYAIYNPFTGRGVIEGLKMTSYKSRRHIVATSILKKTGNVDMAAWALCDTPGMIRATYGRFLPSEKTVRAHNVLSELLYE